MNSLRILDYIYKKYLLWIILKAYVYISKHFKFCINFISFITIELPTYLEDNKIQIHLNFIHYMPYEDKSMKSFYIILMNIKCTCNNIINLDLFGSLVIGGTP